jgi:hypothetical protein
MTLEKHKVIRIKRETRKNSREKGDPKLHRRARGNCKFIFPKRV